MFHLFNRFSLARQAASTLVAMLLLTLGVLFFWANNNSLDNEVAHTRTVADMADAFRTLASKHAGFYVRRPSTEEIATVGRYLDTVSISRTTPEGDVVVDSFHQKNPFLALADYSDVVAASPARAKFRIVSDNYMNPANAPNFFELSALASLRRTQQVEYYQLDNGLVRYARPIRAEASCLKCHGDFAKVPASVKRLFPLPGKDSLRAGGYGYRVGDLVGLTSVSVPHISPKQMLMNQGYGFWTCSALLVSLMGFTLMLIVNGIVRPLREQTAYARELAESDDPGRVVAPRMTEPWDSDNELARSHHSLQALQESLRVAQSWLSREPSGR